MPPYVHPTAVVDPGAWLGEGASVWHFVHVSAGARVGPRVVLGQGVYVGPGVRVGARSRVQNHVSLFSGVEIGEDVFLGPSCVFTNVLHPRAHVSRKDRFLTTRVGCGATVGANATVLCGRTLGDFALVGAGAVVVADVPDHVLVVGNPARAIGFVCRCGERLSEVAGTRAVCGECGLHYRLDGGRCRVA